MENNYRNKYQYDPRGLGFYTNYMNYENESKTIATDVKNMLRCSFYLQYLYLQLLHRINTLDNIMFSRYFWRLGTGQTIW